jgi:sterol desaturase/sphingolipid hydroxylase (fatty acid hydroxylase superfamily)
MTPASNPTFPTPRANQLSASPRIFKNAVLDRLSRAHWTVPFAYLVPVALLLWEGAGQLPTAGLILCVVLGYLAWTLTEYSVHRFLFHLHLPGETGARIHFLIHGIHHDHPSDPLRLVMPPLMSIPLVTLTWIGASLLFGAPLKYPLMAGYMLGMVIYDELHYHLHCRRPGTQIGVWLRRIHMLHHFRHPESHFGVSAPYWDYIFGTVQRRREDRGLERPT